MKKPYKIFSEDDMIREIDKDVKFYSEYTMNAPNIECNEDYPRFYLEDSCSELASQSLEKNNFETKPLDYFPNSLDTYSLRKKQHGGSVGKVRGHKGE